MRDYLRMNTLDRAINLMGGVTKLAAAIGQRQNTVSNWRARGRVPAEHCAAIEEATTGEVTRQMLRPDIFGPCTGVDSKVA